MTYPSRHMVFCAAVCAFGTLWGFAAAADRFVGGMEDVPLVAGLTESPEARIEIDTPAGPILQVMATGSPSKADVQAFYAETLPRLGWQPEGAGVFCRQGQTLAIELEESVSPWITVRFTVFPEEERTSP